MCHEFWRFETTRIAEDAARKRALELIDKARTAAPAANDTVVASEQEEEKETAPA
jgi:hypothetical protein